MVFRFDDAVGCAAFAWDVAVKKNMLEWAVFGERSRLLVDVQIYEFTAFVLHDY